MTASYRPLQSLVYHLFPIDGRRKRGRIAETLEIRRLGPLAEGPWPYAQTVGRARRYSAVRPYLLGTALAYTLLAWLFWRIGGRPYRAVPIQSASGVAAEPRQAPACVVLARLAAVLDLRPGSIH